MLKHDPVKSVNPLADICNIVSLKHALPVSAEDYDAIVGSLRLCVTAGGNDFQPLDSWTKDPALAGEVCYLDDEGAVRRCWNWCSGERTVYRASSKSALVIVESVDPARREELEAALAELSRPPAAQPGRNRNNTCHRIERKPKRHPCISVTLGRTTPELSHE